MASFDLAIEPLLAHEGGFSDDPLDSGGATSWGISSRWVEQHGLSIDVRTLTRDGAIDLYRRYWWAYTVVDSQEIANKLLDMAVNLGINTAHRLLQASLNRLGKTLKQDGVFGDLTLKAVNSVPVGELLRELRAAQALRYVRIVLANPTQEKFIVGWIRRAVA